jgi:PTS system nitrogen regulatory IIA component
MDLKIKDVAELLSVSETTIRRWLSEGKIPAYRLHHQYRFSRIEIEDWMMSCRLDQQGEDKEEPVEGARKGMHQFSLYRAMHRGEVLTDLSSDTKETIIAEVMSRVAKTLGMDADVMTEMLIDREKMMPTALSNGTAVPHTRDFLLKKPFDVVVVASLKTPIDWGALDGKKVHTLFFLFASDDKRHLNLLAKLAHLSSSEEALEFLQTPHAKADLLEYIKSWESKIRYLNG